MNERASFPKYRWVILAIFMFISVVIQIQWLTHAAVARPAEMFYSGQFNPEGFFNIDFLAISYMLVFIIMSFPASYIINKYGIKKSLIFGAILAGFFSMTKAIFASDFNWIVVSQIGLAIAQPFILNSVTAVTVRWFPLKDRAMAAGLSSLAQYIGIVIAMLVTPMLIVSDPSLDGYGSGFDSNLIVHSVSEECLASLTCCSPVN